ncbi:MULTISPECIES: hypothetical protein [unclassified Microbacterium]|uniref:hypothetical protein n=1 Tax=unclassified Microbacterium TaxID=2609290 RepID=UPI003019AD4C
MRKAPTLACPFCREQVKYNQISYHVNACSKQPTLLAVVPPAEVLTADSDWFAEHPNCWTLRRRITDAEAIEYRKVYGLAADTNLYGVVIVLRPYQYDDRRDLYSYEHVRVGERSA